MQNIDLFGSIVGITYKGQNRYKSSFGGVAFIIAVLLCLITIIFFFQKFLSRDSPKMVLQEEKFWNPPEIDLTDFKFMMKFNGENVFNNDVIKVKPLLTRVEQKQGNQTEIELEQIPCEVAMFPGAEEQFESLELSKGICVDTTNISIQGGLVNDIFQYITIRFMLCLDESEGCIQSDKLDEYIDNVQPYALVYLYDSAFQPFNPEKFITHYFDSFEVDITFDDTKYSDIYLSNNKLIIEEGIFLSSSKSTISSIMFETSSYNDSGRAERGNVALDINLKSYKRRQVTNITYMQLSELLANVSAITGNLILLFTFFVEKVNNTLFQKEIIESFFRTGLEVGVINSEKKLECSQQVQGTMTFIHKSTLANQPDFIKNSLNSGLSTLKSKSCKLSVKEIILYSLLGESCYKRSQQYNALKVLNKKIADKQDLLNLILRFQDLELLKYLTLTNEQLGLFDVIKKPALMFEHENIVFLNNYSKSSLKEKPEKLQKVAVEKIVSTLQTKTNKSDIDKRFIEMLKLKNTS
jgi:hypothetical protein